MAPSQPTKKAASTASAGTDTATGTEASTEASTEDTVDPKTGTAQSSDKPLEVEPPAEALDTGASHNTPATDAPIVNESGKSQADLDDGRVSVVLAHPLDRDDDIRRLRLDPSDGPFNVGDTIRLHRDDARTVINAGYAQVDPANRHAVSEVLSGKASTGTDSGTTAG